MATWQEMMQEIKRLRKLKSDKSETSYHQRIRLQRLSRQIIAMAKAGAVPANTVQGKTNLEALVEQAAHEDRDAGRQLQTAIQALYPDQHPRLVIENIPDNIPFILFPVRLETRFIKTGTTSELWLRVYPDDLLVHTHEPLLTDAELVYGKRYWLAVFASERIGGEEGVTLKKQAWKNLAEITDNNRAAWVAKQTRPENWQDSAVGSDPAALRFPAHELTKEDQWSRAPRTRLLPDRFVVQCYLGNSIMIEQAGNLIPDELVLGPDPMDGEEGFAVTGNEIVFGEQFRWLSDFELAVRNGMGFKIPLTVDLAVKGFDKIIVLGVSLSTDPVTVKDELAELIGFHQYSPGGISIVEQGTTTNRTVEADASPAGNQGWEEGFYYNAGDPLLTKAHHFDGRFLADAIGIDYDVVAQLIHTDATGQEEMTAMNRVLYASTLGYFFDTMLSPVLDEPTRAALQQFFIKNVSGRGPVPVIRTGDQPYGILLTSDFSKWGWPRGDISENTAFNHGLLRLMKHYQTIWQSLEKDLDYVGKPGSDPSETLKRLLELNAGSVLFSQRIAYTPEDLKQRGETGTGSFSEAINAILMRAALVQFIRDQGGNIPGGDTDPQLPLVIRLYLQAEAALLDAQNIIDDLPLSDSGGLGREGSSLPDYLGWLETVTSVADIESNRMGDGVKVPSSLLFLQVRRSMLLELHEAVTKWFISKGVAIKTATLPKHFLNLGPDPDLSKWELLKAKVGLALPYHPAKDLAVADVFLSAEHEDLRSKELSDFRKQLKLLRGLPTARLERCFTEHLDTCTYRLDAWQTALFNMRLQKQRTDDTVGGRRTETARGAFGWLLDVRPSSGRTTVASDAILTEAAVAGPFVEFSGNGGFVHSPSISQAMTAAVLRNGYLTHANEADPELMTVNLSSGRIRRATAIIDGIRNGQRLEVLLGYQFERELHDRASANPSLAILNFHIYTFRETYGIRQHYLRQQGSEDDSSINPLPMTEVVNGLELAERADAFPFGTSLPASLDAAVRDAIIAAKNNLEDTLDAVKDLLTSESVYQLVQGNFTRAGAVMNSLKESEIPPETEVIKSPKNTQLSFTNRVMLRLDTSAPSGPVPPQSLRAQIEPGLTSWLNQVIGSLDEIYYHVSHVLPDLSASVSTKIFLSALGLASIDLVYIVTGGSLTNPVPLNQGISELEQRIAFHYRARFSLDDTALVKIDFARTDGAQGQPLAQGFPLITKLGALIHGARYASPDDFVPPSGSSTSSVNGFDVAEYKNRYAVLRTAIRQFLTDLGNIPVSFSGNIPTLSGTGRLQQLFDYKGEPLEAGDFQISQTDTNTVSENMIRISMLGVPHSFPNYQVTSANDKSFDLVMQVITVVATLGQLLSKSDALVDETDTLSNDSAKTGKISEAFKGLLGGNFKALPLFRFSNAEDIAKSIEGTPQLLRFASEELGMSFPADEWLLNVSYVRPQVAFLESVLLLAEIGNGYNGQLLPIQLPYRTDDSWLAVQFPAMNAAGEPFSLADNTVAITMLGSGDLNVESLQSGLMIDEWNETIPVPESITGIGYHYDQPNAAPPQVILLAVSPRVNGSWTWDDLIGILNDTLVRVKLRAIEPEMLRALRSPEVGMLLPAVWSSFSRFDLDLSVDYRANVEFYQANVPQKTVYEQ